MASASQYADDDPDSVKIYSAHYRVELENKKVRVLRIRYGPHEKSVMHQHHRPFRSTLRSLISSSPTQMENRKHSRQSWTGPAVPASEAYRKPKDFPYEGSQLSC